MKLSFAWINRMCFPSLSNLFVLISCLTSVLCLLSAIPWYIMCSVQAFQLLRFVFPEARQKFMWTRLLKTYIACPREATQYLRWPLLMSDAVRTRDEYIFLGFQSCINILGVESSNKSWGIFEMRDTRHNAEEGRHDCRVDPPGFDFHMFWVPLNWNSWPLYCKDLRCRRGLDLESIGE